LVCTAQQRSTGSVVVPACVGYDGDMNRTAQLASVLVVGAGLLWMLSIWQAHEHHGVEPSAPPPRESAPITAPKEPAPALPSHGPAATEPAVSARPSPPSQPSAAPPHAPGSAEGAEPDLFTQDTGPVAEWRQRFETEPRDSAAAIVESSVRTAFAHPDGAPTLFKSVLCRETICKLELRWSPDRLGPYVAGMTRAMVQFDRQVAASPVGPPDADHVRPIEVYLKRAAPAAKP
jgi:hypothetical protein